MYRKWFITAALALLIAASPAVAQFPTPPFVSCTAYPNNANVGSHGVAVDSVGTVHYVNVGSGLISQIPGTPGLNFTSTVLPHPVVNVAIDPNTDDIYMSGSTGRVLRSPPGGGAVNQVWGPVGVCNFLDHIHFHSDGFVYSTCLDGNWIIRFDPAAPGGGGVAGVDFFVFPAPTVNSATAGITGDFTGDLWSIERSAHNVVRAVPALMVPTTSAGITEFAIPSSPYAPETVKACLNNIWFTGLNAGANGPRVDFLDITTLPVPVITQIDLNPGGGGGTYGLAVDGNGNPWATILGSNIIAGVDVVGGFVPALFATPTSPHHVAISPTAGDFWYTDFGNRIYQCVPDIPVPATCEPTDPPCDPDPRTQGYWHRQCLGLSASDPDCPGIDPGRNGRGPQSPTEPGFCPDLYDCAFDALEDLGMFGISTCEGLDANPPSDMCEKALKQLTALILNVCSERLQDGCEVDVSAEGCDSTDVGDLLTELADLINGGGCQTANDCAEAVNEGEALVSPGGGAPEANTTLPGKRDDYAAGRSSMTGR